jgi:hypothetical protein
MSFDMVVSVLQLVVFPSSIILSYLSRPWAQNMTGGSV